jgi:hypothetical protein
LRFIDFEDLSERDYITILLDLLLYKNEPLVRNAIEILSLHFSQKTNLINRLKEIQLIEDISMQKDKKRIKSIKNDLQDLAEQIEEWYPECQKVDTLHHKKAIKTIQLLKELCKFCTVKIAKEIPEDEPMTKKGTDDGGLSERQQTERDITRGHAFMYDEKAAATF